MLKITIEILIMFILTIGIMRLMGKSSIVQLTPYDLVAIIIVGTIIAEPLISPDFWPAILRSVIIVLLYLLFAKLSLNQIMNKFLLGEPSILIKHGKIVEDVLEREHISLIQLLSILRTAGYSKLTEIEYAILEPTGSISVIPISSARPVTLSDLNIEGEYEGLPLAVVIDGKIQKKNLQLVDKDEAWVMEKIRSKGVTDLKQIIYGFIDDQNSKIYLNLRDSPNSENELISDQTTAANNDMNYTQKIYLVKNKLIQLDGLKEARIKKSELFQILKVNNLSGIDEVVLEKKIHVTTAKE